MRRLAQSIDVTLSRPQPWSLRPFAVCSDPPGVASIMRTSQPTTTNNTGAHGLGPGLGAAAAQRLPVPPRERKPALAALAVILILGGALVSAYLVMASGQRVNAVSISQPVAAGQLIPDSALKQVQIGNTGIPFIYWTEHNK